jgi:O-antigen ligase
MTRWTAALAAIASGGGTLLVLLVYAPAAQAPFLVPKFAVLELAASLGLASFVLRRLAPGGPRWTRAVSGGALLVLTTSAVAWLAAALTPAGAPYAIDAIARWGSLFGIACGASVIADLRGPRQRVLETVTMAAAVVATLGLLQHLELTPVAIPVISRPGSTFGNRNLAADAMAMALPLGVGAAAGARTRAARVATVAALILELVFLAVTRTRGAWIGAACGLGVTLWLVRSHVGRPVLYLAAGAGAAAVVAAWLPGRLSAHDAGDVKRYSTIADVLEQGADLHSLAVRTRLGLWRRTTAMVRDHPWLGVGPGNWPVAFPRYAEPNALQDAVLSAARAPRQAHEDWLERAAETGIVGLLALAALAAGAAGAVRQRHASPDADTSRAASAAGGALAALAGLSLASFPLEMPATIGLAGLALGLVAPGPEREQGCRTLEESGPERERGSRTLEESGPEREQEPRAPQAPATRARAAIAVVEALFFIAFAGVRAERNIRSSLWLGAAERAMRPNQGSAGTLEALADLDRSLAVKPDDYRAEFRAAQMLLRQHRSGAAAQAALRAIAIEPSAPNGWAVLAAAELDGGDDDAAERDASVALTLLQDYPFALDVRANAAERHGDEVAAAADRRRIDALANGPSTDETARDARALKR